MNVRNLAAADHPRVLGVVDAWWGGRPMAGMLPRLFFTHFTDTSFVADDESGRLTGFLVGFLSQSDTDAAYCHFIGVDPDRRSSGLGRSLYERFFTTVGARARRVVRAITSPLNAGSIAFHRKMGFAILPGPAEHDGVSFHSAYDGPGQDRVLFERRL